MYEAYRIWQQENCDDDYDELDPRRCPHCNAFVSVKPTSGLYVEGPDIVSRDSVDCKRCGREIWSSSIRVACVWPREDFSAPPVIPADWFDEDGSLVF